MHGHLTRSHLETRDMRFALQPAILTRRTHNIWHYPNQRPQLNSCDLSRGFEVSCQRNARSDRTSRITWCVRVGDADLDKQGNLRDNIRSSIFANKISDGHSGASCAPAGTYRIVD